MSDHSHPDESTLMPVCVWSAAFHNSHPAMSLRSYLGLAFVDRSQNKGWGQLPTPSLVSATLGWDPPVGTLS